MSEKEFSFQNNSCLDNDDAILNIFDVTNITKREVPLITKNLKKPKTLVLDLDETLVHTSFSKLESFDHIVKINIDEGIFDIYVQIRPGLDRFLEKMQYKFDIVIFTASLQKYADSVIDSIQQLKKFSRRYYRNNCRQINDEITKDLSIFERDLRDIIIVDNSPKCYMFQPENAIPIESWTSDKLDTKLDELTPILEALSNSIDVRKDIPILLRNQINIQNKIDTQNQNQNLNQNQNQNQNSNLVIKNEEPLNLNSKITTNIQDDKNKISYYDNMIKLLDERIKKSQELHEKYMEISKFECHKTEVKDENENNIKNLFSTPKRVPSIASDLSVPSVPSEPSTSKNSTSYKEKVQENQCFSFSSESWKASNSSKSITHSQVNPYLYANKYFKEYNPILKTEIKFKNLIGTTNEMGNNQLGSKINNEKRE